MNEGLGGLGHLLAGGEVFGDEDGEERAYLVETLLERVGVLSRTVFLYRLLPHNTHLFYQYLDGHPHILLVAKAPSGKIIAAYSSEPFAPECPTRFSHVLLFSLWRINTW